MRAMRWPTCLLIASAALGSGCERVPSNALPKLAEYSDAFQAKAAEEMETDQRRPCDPVQPVGDCSAMKRLVIDYGHTREEIRAAGGGDE